MTANKKTENGQSHEIPLLTCGLVMPISPIDGCSAEHWSDVKQIIQDAVESIAEPKFFPQLVSDADDVGVIQKRIVQGIYNSDVVVCDVSGRNSNVMFELGMRLAFDKPTVIIKDDKTDYSFDTSIIEHLLYPRDLRFSKIVAFKQHLAEKILATYKAAKKDSGHSTFLKSFGKFTVANLQQETVTSDQLILETLHEMQIQISSLRIGMNRMVSISPTTQVIGPTMPPKTSTLQLVSNILHDIKYKNPEMKLADLNEIAEYIGVNYSGFAEKFNTKEDLMKLIDKALSLMKN